MKIYADNAATTKMNKAAIEAMLPYMNEIYGNPSSLHTAGQIANEALEKAKGHYGQFDNAAKYIDPRHE